MSDRLRILRSEKARAAAPAVLARRLPTGAPGAPLPSVADQLEAARAAGYDDGYRAGIDTAARSVDAERVAQLRRLVDAVERAAAAVAPERARLVDHLGGEAAQLAFELAEVLVQRELAHSQPGVDAVRRALALVPDGEDIVVRLHPHSAVDVDEVAQLVPASSVRFVPDPAVEADGCVVEAGPCRIDAQIGPALQRARAVLAGAGAGAIDCLVGVAGVDGVAGFDGIDDGGAEAGAADAGGRL